LRQAFRAVGLDVRRAADAPDSVTPVDFTRQDVAVIDFVLGNRLTMVTRQRLIATINACKHAVRAEIDGDFVECGVWRGGNAIAAKMTFENYASDKRVWLFDTFAGMTAPTDVDRAAFTGGAASDEFEQHRRADHNAWCYASIEDVRRNFAAAGVAADGIRFVQGDVLSTLADAANLPEAISVLRLDTDWYESTRAELEVLYPRLATGGSLLIDDFGHWEGARKAVEEYFEALAPPRRPLLHYTDHTGRMAVKP
jgi:hypothetical protein